MITRLHTGICCFWVEFLFLYTQDCCNLLGNDLLHLLLFTFPIAHFSVWAIVFRAMVLYLGMFSKTSLALIA